MPKVSVIVPIYGVEKYIERCARSLFEQTLDDMEFVFVNDCTKDNSIAVLEKVIEDYPNRKEQIKILKHECNKGLPKARETGVDNATGEYVAHCDSDDWVDLEMYKKMYENAKRNDVDTIICGYYIYYNENQKRAVVNKPYNDNYSILRGLFRHTISPSIWAKMTKRELYLSTKIVYAECNMAEDFVLSLQLLMNSKKIGFLNECLYHYFYNEQAMTKQNTLSGLLRKRDQLQANVYLIEEILKRNNKYLEYKDLLVYTKLSFRNTFLEFCENDEVYKLWHNTFPEIKSLILFNKEASISQKIKFYVCAYKIWPFYKKFIK